MATERTQQDPRIAAQAVVLRAWGQAWRRAQGASQQDLGRAAGYGSDLSPKSAAVAVSRIEAGKTEPTGRYRRRLLEVLGHTEEELQTEADAVAARGHPNPLTRVLAGAVHEENEARRARILAASNRLTQRATFQIETSERTFERIRDEFVLPFLERAVQVEWPRDDGGGGIRHDLHPPTQDERIRGLRAQTRASVVRALDEGASGRASGGPGSAAGVFAAVSAGATASTGSAIAAVSGAASSSAALAWLGRGSLGTGGLGVAGGAAVLAGVVSLPALLALGGVLFWKGRRLRREAEAEAEKLDAAQQALEDMQQALDRAEAWHESQQDVVQRAGLLGRTLHARVVEPALRAGGGRMPWGSLPAPVRDALAAELDLVAIVLDTRALPVWLEVAAVGQPEPTGAEADAASQSAEWIRGSLALAEADLDEHEDAVRSVLARGPQA